MLAKKNAQTSSRSNFTGKIGFVLAAAGSAVGLGNLWRFPYCAAKYGGGMFLLLYVILAVTFGFALMVAEISIGRKTKLSAICAYDKLKPEYSFVGVLAALVPIIIMPYYCVIGGWVLKFLWSYITMPASQVAAIDAAGANTFTKLISSPTEPLLWFLLFIGITVFIIAIGVEKGVEGSSKILMPILVILIATLAVYCCSLPNAKEGIKYYLVPRIEDLTVKTILSAMNQLFYSLSLAMGIMITYGSYMKKNINIESAVWQIEIFDTIIAFLAGLVIIPAVYACGDPASDLKAGPSLMFVILPKLFTNMRGGRIVAIILFFLVFFAALTSSISLYETNVSIIMDKFKQKRTPAIMFVLFISLIIGFLASLGYGPLAMITFLGMQFLDLFDFISNSILMPVVAFFTCIFVGYVIKPKTIISEVESSGKFRLKKLFTIIIKYVAPILILIILVAAILQAFGKIEQI